MRRRNLLGAALWLRNDFFDGVIQFFLLALQMVANLVSAAAIVIAQLNFANLLARLPRTYFSKIKHGGSSLFVFHSYDFAALFDESGLV